MWKTIGVILIFSAVNCNGQKLIQFGDIKKLNDKVNTSSEEIMPLVSNDGKSLYFVRARHESNEGGEDTGHDIWSSNIKDNDYEEAKHNFGKLNNIGNNAIVGISKDDSKFYLLNAYKSENKLEKGVAITDNNFSKPTFVQINQMDYSSEFYGFYVNPEETVMFISMKGANSKGEEDLYVSINQNGEWQQPVQLSSEINSSGFEISPFLSRDGKRLYFSSNGHGGEGDADIFYVEKIGEGWTNWGAPINIGSNINSSGFDAYFSEASDSVAYFASTRDAEKSDIYSLTISWKEVEEEIVEVIEEVIEVIEIPEEIIVDNNPPLPNPHIGNIYFDVDKFFIRKEAEENLDNLVKIMKEMPNLLVTLEGHTDKTYLVETNQILSENRAKSARKYLTNKGIDKSRITIIGYGETKPDIPCDECTPEQHQKNRRVEFVLSWKK
jgi:outer membrane protein OmpA-like peptidoglycan-associated protein